MILISLGDVTEKSYNYRIGTLGIGSFPVRNPLGARPHLGIQPRYEAPGDLRVEIVQMQLLTSG